MEKTFVYKPRGVCSREITVVLDGDTVQSVKFRGGCSGTTQGVAALAQGRTVDELIALLAGIDCGGKGTSCPDQLSKALIAAKASAEQT